MKYLLSIFILLTSLSQIYGGAKFDSTDPDPCSPDIIKPTPFCFSKIIVEYNETTGSVEICAGIFNKGSFDNCTAEEEIVLTLGLSGGTVEDATPSMIFKCDDGISLYPLDIFVTDTAGNSDFCSVELQVDGDCGTLTEAIEPIDPRPIPNITDPDPSCNPVDITTEAVTGVGDSDILQFFSNLDPLTSIADPTSLTTGTYFIRISDKVTSCFTTASTMVVVNQCLDQMDVISITDPCNCDNPDNITFADGTILFIDTLKVTSAVAPVTLSMTDDNLLDQAGNPIPVNTPFVFNALTNMYKLIIYTEQSIPSNIEVSNGVSTIPYSVAPCSRCVPIPTMGQWGLICLSLLLMIVGLVAIKEKELVIG